MDLLNLPYKKLKFKLEKNITQVFDEVRKKYIVLTKEEWVRQQLIHYLNKEKFYPISLMKVEEELKYNSLKKRADIILYNIEGSPLMLVECKAPQIKISQIVIDQISIYNSKIKAPYLLISNGIKHYCWKVDFDKKLNYQLSDIPSFK